MREGAPTQIGRAPLVRLGAARKMTGPVPGRWSSGMAPYLVGVGVVGVGLVGVEGG